MTEEEFHEEARRLRKLYEEADEEIVRLRAEIERLRGEQVCGEPKFV